MKYLSTFCLLFVGLALCFAGCWGADAAVEYAATVAGPPPDVMSTMSTVARWVIGASVPVMGVLITMGKAIEPQLIKAHPNLAALERPAAILADCVWKLLASNVHIAADAAMVSQSKGFISIVGLIHAGQTDPALQVLLAVALAKLPADEADAVKVALQALGPAPQPLLAVASTVAAPLQAAAVAGVSAVAARATA